LNLLTDVVLCHALGRGSAIELNAFVTAPASLWGICKEAFYGMFKAEMAEWAVGEREELLEKEKRNKLFSSIKPARNFPSLAFCYHFQLPKARDGFTSKWQARVAIQALRKSVPSLEC
jgi:hypothetical protein